MRLYGVTGWKNSGKTGLMERLVANITGRGFSVSTVKHAHHSFDVDQPGRDSHRHRQAGASQVLLSSRNRVALMTELRGAEESPLEVSPPLSHPEASKRSVPSHAMASARIIEVRDMRPTSLGRGHPTRFGVRARALHDHRRRNGVPSGRADRRHLRHAIFGSFEGAVHHLSSLGRVDESRLGSRRGGAGG